MPDPTTVAPARTGLYRHGDLSRALSPASIAIIGASTRAGSFGSILKHNLESFAGDVYLVNPRYETMDGQRCYPSVAALPVVPDCAVLAVAREAVEESVLGCAQAGVGGAVVFAAGYAETGKPERAAEQARLSGIARITASASLARTRWDSPISAAVRC